MYLIINKPVNLPLLRQQLDAIGVTYAIEFAGEEQSIIVDEGEQAEMTRLLLTAHDADELTAEQAADAQKRQSEIEFLGNVSSASTAIGEMLADSAAAAARIESLAIDPLVKAELVAMNRRTEDLVEKLLPFIQQVIGLVEVHSTASGD